MQGIVGGVEGLGVFLVLVGNGHVRGPLVGGVLMVADGCDRSG